MKFRFLSEKPRKRLATLSLLVAVLLVTSLVSCSTLSGRQIDGKVVEAGTQKPVAGAIVTALWRGYTSAFPADSQSGCFYVSTVVSDKDGNFHLPSWRKFYRLAPLVTLDEVDISSGVLRQGTVKTENGGSIQALVPWGNGIQIKPGSVFNAAIALRLSPIVATREEKLKMLEEVRRFGCDHAGASAKNFYPTYNFAYEEAKSLAVTDEDKKIVNMLRRLADDILYARDGDEDRPYIRRLDTE